MATISRAQKLRLGIFVGTGLFILFAAILLLAGRALLEQRDLYKIRFSSASVSFSGLEVGSDVKYSGIKIGRVEHLGIAADDVSVIEVRVSVEHGTPIAEDSTASLASQGITGLKYIELSRGSATARVRKPGETIPSGESLLDELSARATAVAAKLDQLLVNLNGMTGPQTQAHFQEILSSASGVLTDNRKNIAEIVANAREVTVELKRLSQRGSQVAGKADRLMSDLNRAGERVNEVLASDGQITRTLEKVDTLIGRMNMVILRSEGDLDVTLRHLREASANLNDFSLALKENPTILINNAQPQDDAVGR